MTETVTTALVATVPNEVTSMMGETDVAVIMKRAPEEAKRTKMPRSPKSHRIKSKREEAAPAPRRRLMITVEILAKITTRRSTGDTLMKVLVSIIKTKISSAKVKTSTAMKKIEIEIATMARVVIKDSTGKKTATVMRETMTTIGTVTDATTLPGRTGALSELLLMREVEMKGRDIETIETVTTSASPKRGKREVRLPTGMIGTKAETSVRRRGKMYARTRAASLTTSRSKATTTRGIEVSSATTIVTGREDTLTQGLLLHLVIEVIEVARMMTNSRRKAGTIVTILTGKRMTTESHRSPTDKIDKVVTEDAHAAAATRSAKTSPLLSSKARARELHSSRSRSLVAGTSAAGAITSRRATREVVGVIEQLRQSKDN